MGSKRTSARFASGKAALLALLALELALAAAGAGLWARSTFADDPNGEFPTPPAEIPRPMTLESAYPVAVERARRWDAGARLILVSAQVDWPLEVPPGPVRELPGGGWLSFVFVRERDGEAESLGLLIERHSGRIVQERVVPWGGPAPESALGLLDLPVGSVAALIAAESAGGTEFRRACPGARHQTRISLGVASAGAGPAQVDAAPPATSGTPAPAGSAPPRSESSSPVWLLGYRDVRDEGRAPLVIAVDSATGAVSVEERFGPAVVGCPL